MLIKHVRSMDSNLEYLDLIIPEWPQKIKINETGAKIWKNGS